jgi:hypothetical protein
MLTKWSQLQIIKSEIYDYIIESPIGEVRKLLLVVDSGYFSLNYIMKKLKHSIENKDVDILQLLYAFEDFMLTHFQMLYSNNEHL